MTTGLFTTTQLRTDALDGLQHEVEVSHGALRRWVEQRDYAGYEPFDLLNSPFLKSSVLRGWPVGILFVQCGKRWGGLRLRRWIRVPASKNPKALGLFIAGYCDLARCGMNVRLEAEHLKSELKRLRSPEEAEYCWGYDWDHVSRASRMPAFGPNVIATVYCARALLDMGQVFGDHEAREMGISAARFVATRLNRPIDTPDHLCFSYTPSDREQVFNASALACALLARVAVEETIPEYQQLARRGMRYLVSEQLASGAWYYGSERLHRWIDSFHTGYNLTAMAEYQRITGDKSFNDAIRRGYAFYVVNFFSANGSPKYFHNSLYPIDIHSCAQAILTFCDFGSDVEQAAAHALAMTRWTIKNMRNIDGTFLFQIHRLWTNRTPYMRWAQAWMFHALGRVRRLYLTH